MSTEKLCLHCGNGLNNRRKNYHEECREPAKAAAKLGVRKCKKCKKTKAASSFVNDESRVDGKFPWCVECQKTYSQDRKFQNPEDELNGNTCPLDDTPVRGHKNRKFCSTYCKDRVRSLWNKFGLTVEQYRLLVAATDGKCPLCLNRVHTWHVDHNHRTRKVTGVVCAACNVGALASTYHDVEYARRVLHFLEETPAERLGVEALAPEGADRPSNLHKLWRRPRGGKWVS